MTVFKKPLRKTLTSIKWTEMIERIATNLICILAFTAFAFITLYSLLQTSVLSPEKYVAEKILYVEDNVFWNIIFFEVFFVAFYFFSKTYGYFQKVDIRIMEIAVFAVPLILGLVWVLSVQTKPAADSMNVFEAASGAAKDDYTGLLSNDRFYNHNYFNNQSYFNCYPFQLGFVFICEMIYRVFGADTAVPLEVFNAICNALAYLAIAKIAGAAFKRKGVEFITIILLLGCFQPILFAAFPYGNTIGMCCALWSAYFLIRYFRTGKYWLFAPIIVLLTLATLAKYNNMIYLVAFAIVLILHAIRAKKWQSLVLILALALCCVGASKLVIFSYEQRAHTQFKSGVSQILYLDLGLNESSMAPGWYTKRGLETYLNSNLDSDAAAETAKKDIQARLETFGSNPEYTYDFFSKKVVSQWNETTYESIWVSKVKSHYIELGDLAKNVYEGDLGDFLNWYFNGYMQLVFVLFTGGILMLLLRKKANIETILLPLVLLGGFGYHLLFEGKSQYLLTYIMLLLPYAAYGAMNIVDLKRSREKKKADAVPPKKRERTAPDDEAQTVLITSNEVNEQ